jgi:DNA-binding transcriptional LysR family regulator
MRADKDNIATFVEVRHLGVPKSTVSRRLARLEEQLDTKLVHRDARRVTPTPEGTRFYDSVVDAVDVLDTAVATIEESTTKPRGTIRITAPSDLGRMLLLHELVGFMERYPDISLDLVFTNRFVDLVQERVDVAVRAGLVTEPNLIARKLLPSDFQLAAHASTGSAGGRRSFAWRRAAARPTKPSSSQSRAGSTSTTTQRWSSSSPQGRASASCRSSTSRRARRQDV